MYPSLLLLHPDVASSVVNYRANTIAGARANAYAGTRFAWESANDGTEQTPTFTQGTRTYEQHITSDVAFAQWQYFLATGDKSWLESKGWPVLPGRRGLLGQPRGLDQGDGSYAITGRRGPRRASLQRRQRGLHQRRRDHDDASAPHRAATLLGKQPNPAWKTVAAGLAGAAGPEQPDTAGVRGLHRRRSSSRPTWSC